jgi:hypothetical protein
MRCLSESSLQAFADGEAVQGATEHVTQCSRCRARVEQIRRDAQQLTSALNSMGEMPFAASARVREALAGGAPRRGATRLRAPDVHGSWRRRMLVTGLATAAVVAVVVFGVLPRFDAPTTLSASEVLTRSLRTLSSTQGIEMLEYELVVDGVAHGSWRIEQVIDREQPTRYRVAMYTPDGLLRSAFSQDSLRGRRSQLVRVDDRNYLIEVEPVSRPVLSLPQMGQALIETAIAMMQASADQHLTIEGNRYVIEMPAVTPGPTAATFELTRARTVVNGDEDFRIEEFEASGTLLRQAFSISFRLLRRTVVASVSVSGQESPFEIQSGPGDVMLKGVESDEPVTELLTTLIRGLSPAR